MILLLIDYLQALLHTNKKRLNIERLNSNEFNLDILTLSDL